MRPTVAAARPDDPDAFPVARAPVRWLVLPMLAAFAAYYTFFLQTPAAGRLALPLLLSLSWVPVLLALAAAVRSRRRGMLLDVSPSAWRDGDAVAVCGRLAVDGAPLQAPLRGQDCAAWEWQLVLPRGKQRDVVFGRGTALASARLDTPHGPIALRGVPRIEVDRSPDIVTESARARLARHLLGADVERQLASSHPLPDLDAVMRGDHPLVHAEPGADGRLAFAFARPPHEGPLADVGLWSQAEATARFGESSQAVQAFAAALQSGRYRVFESIIPVGAPVCAYGTWNARDRRLMIGPPTVAGRQHALIGRDAAQERRAARVGALVLVILSLIVPAVANGIVFARVAELAALRGG